MRRSFAKKATNCHRGVFPPESGSKCTTRIKCDFFISPRVSSSGLIGKISKSHYHTYDKNSIKQWRRRWSNGHGLLDRGQLTEQLNFNHNVPVTGRDVRSGNYTPASIFCFIIISLHRRFLFFTYRTEGFTSALTGNYCFLVVDAVPPIKAASYWIDGSIYRWLMVCAEMSKEHQ